MKRYSILCAFIFISALFFSCNKPANNHPATIPVGMSAIINNSSWEATSYYAKLDTNISDTVVSLYIFGGNSFTSSIYGENTFSFSIPYFKYKIKTYILNNAIDTDVVTLLYYYFNYYQPNSGTITITQISDTNVQGTFNWVGDGITVTNGQFNVPIQ